ncbi:T9SS C-terminal target domain-containing protein [Bacteroidetes/Chlorobi group bacterium ChocPot_Mid]|nr:MAG: T9SS C-terminal target domain-containing protein [Bacteroidetes/Chlorobi group bacterium ChocPot_Mid]
MKIIISLFIILFSNFALSQPTIKNCFVFPKNNIWNTPIAQLPVHPKSSDYIKTIGAGLSLRNDFGSGLWNGAPIGIPYVLVGSYQQKITVNFQYSDESDKSGYPIPDNPPIEGGNESTGDRHILIIDTNNCKLYELYSAYQNNDKSWRAGSGAIYDLNSNKLRPEGWTSADAAGLPIFPGLVKFDEVQSGEINHMIRFTVPKTQRKYLWPARHYASSITDENYPPMGIVMRLKSSFNTDKLSPQAKVIANALKKYGMILADNGSAWFMSGVPDNRWDMDDLYTLRQIKGSDFEAVDISSLMVDINSAEARNTSNSVPVTSITLNKDTVNLLVGDTTSLIPTVLPENATNKNVIWNSNNPEIASVNSNGLVNALTPGTATITVTTIDGGFEDFCSITVKDNIIKVTGINLDKNKIMIAAGHSEQLNFDITPSNATDKRVTWSSDRPDIASVNDSGLVTGHLPDSTTHIYVTTVDGGFSDICEVSVTMDVGVNDNDFKSVLTISPNPASDYIEFKLSESSKLSESYSFQIYNTLGVCVMVEQSTSPIQKIDISHLPSGIYFVKYGNYTENFLVVR